MGRKVKSYLKPEECKIAPKNEIFELKTVLIALLDLQKLRKQYLKPIFPAISVVNCVCDHKDEMSTKIAPAALIPFIICARIKNSKGDWHSAS